MSSRSFRERWLADAACAFPAARAAGVADDLDSYLDEFHSLRDFRPEAVAGLPLDEATVAFLLANGLPNESPPYLSLHPTRSLLRPLADVWGAHDAGGIFARSLCHYSDGSGNSIAVDSRDSTVIWIDHEDRVVVPRYVNISVAVFAEFLLAAQRRSLSLPVDATLARLDPRAFADDSFWASAGRGGPLSEST